MAYEMTQWGPGDPITQECMNKIEQGIYDATQTANNADSNSTSAINAIGSINSLNQNNISHRETLVAALNDVASTAKDAKDIANTAASDALQGQKAWTQLLSIGVKLDNLGNIATSLANVLDYGGEQGNQRVLNAARTMLEALNTAVQNARTLQDQTLSQQPYSVSSDTTLAQRIMAIDKVLSAHSASIETNAGNIADVNSEHTVGAGWTLAQRMQQLTNLDAEVKEARKSTYYHAPGMEELVFDSLDKRLENSEKEVVEARQSTINNFTYSSLDDRLETNEAAINERVKYNDIIDNLDSTIVNKPLSAKQGNVIKNMFGSGIGVTQGTTVADLIEATRVSAQNYANTAETNAKNHANTNKVDKTDIYNGVDHTADDQKVLDARVGKTLQDAIDAINSNLNTADTGLVARLGATEDAIDILNSNASTTGSVLNTVNTRIAEVVNSAPEAFDTLKEIADWIGTHNTDALDMQQDISDNADAISALQTRMTTAETDIDSLQADLDTASTGLKARVAALEDKDTIIVGIPETGSNYTEGVPNIPTNEIKANADYLIADDDGKYFYWRYINNNWKLISGAGSGNSSAIVFNSYVEYESATATDKNEFTDYYVKDANNYYTHYRFIKTRQNNEDIYVQVEIKQDAPTTNQVYTKSETYNKLEVANAISEALNNVDISSYTFTYGTQNYYGPEGQAGASQDTVPVMTENVLSLFKLDQGATEPISVSQAIIVGGGGSSTSGAPIEFTRITETPLIITSTSSAIVSFEYNCIDDNIPIGGYYTWYKGNQQLFNGSLTQGINTFDLTEYCTVGTSQRFKLVITNEQETALPPKFWDIQIVELGLESNFNDNTIYSASNQVEFTYIPYGNISKTVHIELDGVELDTTTTSDSGRTNSYRLPLLAHGSHIVKVWLTAIIQNNTISTDPIYKHVICVAAGNNIPIIGCIYEYPYYTDLEHTNEPGYVFTTQYNTLSIPYYVYDPLHQFPQVSLQESGGSINNRELSVNDDIWSYKASDYTVNEEEELNTYKTLTINCDVTSVTIRVKIEKLDIGIEPITANLAFDLNPAGKSNDNSTDRLRVYTPGETILNENEIAVSENFDWNNGGWKLDENGNTYFGVKSGSRAYINYELFNRDLNISDNGQELKCIFKVEQVRNIQASFLRCLSSQANDNAGFEMRAHEAYVKTSAASLYLPYSEEDIIEFEYNILSKNNGSYIMGYEDGVATRPLIYDELTALYQNSPAIIEIGSDDCDIRIYRLKIYTSSLTDEDILMNFYADAFNSDEMIARYERNQIYDENNKLTPWSVADACPDLKVIMIEAPYFTNDKGNYVKNTNVTCLHKGGDDVLDNWYFENGFHVGQGTTSNEYGAAGRNIDIIFGFDGEHTVVSKIKENDVQGYVSKVTLGVDNQGQGVPIERRRVLTGADAKIALTHTSIPNNWFNIKVNIASSENANNALLQKRYNDFLPYTSPARKRDPRIKNDMEFVNCVVFIKESGPVSEHREFLDNEWHFYAIGNIGDSKKTDNTRVNDPQDIKEFCVEISDNTLPNSAFYTGVYWANAEHTAVTFDENIGYEMKYPITINKIPTDLQPWIEVGYKKVDNPSAANLSSLYELNNGTYSLTQDSSIDSEKTYYEYFTRTIANDVVNEWSEFDGYAPVTASNQLNKKNLKQFYEYNNGNYTLTADTAINDNKTYYIRQYKNRRYQSLYIPIQKYDPIKEKYSYISGWDTSFEFRYDMGTKDGESFPGLEEQQELSKLKFSEMYEWVISSSNEDFVEHFDDWFITDSYLYWYLFTERYTMIDSRAKNTFYHYGKVYINAQEAEELGSDAVNYTLDPDKASINNGYRFELWDYDNDTALGINNSGELTLTYGKEDIDYRIDGNSSSGYVYNAAESVIWRRIRRLMGSQLTTMYNNRPAACWSAASLIKEFDDWQAQFPEELWRLDIERKYLRTYLTGSYDSNHNLVTTDRFLKEMMNGRKKYQRRQFERDQEIYIGTKYISSSVKADQIMFRCNKPETYVVKPDFNLQIVPYSDMYLTVVFGNSDPVQYRAKAGETVNVPSILTEMTDTAVLIYAASHIQALNDLSACYIHDNDFSKATKLSTLIIGNSTPGYTNTFLTGLHLGNNGLLTTLDIRNCPNLNEALNLSSCQNLTTLNASNTSLTTISFAIGGKLTTAILPATLTNLTVNNLKRLTNLSIAGYDNLTVFYCKDTNNINPLAIVQETIDTLNEVTVLGLDWTLNDSSFSLLETIMGKSVSMLSGTIHTNQQVRQHILNDASTKYKNQLIIDHAGLIVEYTILYKNYNGELLYTDYRTNTERYRDPASLHVDDINPDTNTSRIAWNRLVKPADAEFIYKFGTYSSDITQDQSTYVRFSGWFKEGTTTNPLANELVNGPMTFFAVYPTTQTRQYTVRWFEEEGGSAKMTVTRNYGTDISGISPAPETAIVRAKKVGNIVKVFKGWNRPVGRVTEDLDIYAQWETSTIDNSITSDELNMATLNAADIYALSLLDNNVKSSIFENQLTQSPIFVQMGHEFNYTAGVDTIDLLNGASKLVFSGIDDGDIKIYDGAHGMGEIRPLALNQDWTIALDYKFLLNNTVLNTTKEFVLASCYKNADSAIDGFKLSLIKNTSSTDPTYKNHQIVVTWGTQSVTIDYLATAVDTTANAKQYMRGYRNMVVLRHNTTNPNNLYVYYALPATDSNYGLTDYGYGCEYGTTINNTTLTWDSNRNINTPLILGGNLSGNSTSDIEQDQNNRGPAKAIIYWAKYWNKDLGNKNCRILASWPHEKIPFYLSGYSGNNQTNRQIIDNTRLTFVAAQGIGDRYLLATRKLYQTTNNENIESNDVVWSYSRARNLCNNRIYNGFSTPYQSIIMQATLSTYGKNQNTDEITSYNTSDYIFLTAEAELTSTLSYGDKAGEILLSAGIWPWLKARNIKNLYGFDADQNLIRQDASSINPFLFRFVNGYINANSIIFNTGNIDPDSNNSGWQMAGHLEDTIYPKSGDVWIKSDYNNIQNVAFMYFTNAEINEGIYVDIPTTRGGWKKADLWQLRSLNLGASGSTENLFERIDDNGKLIDTPTPSLRRTEPRLLCPEFAI